MTIPEVQNLAELARIKLNDEEAQELGESLESVLTYVSELGEVQVQAELESPGDNYNQMRDDVVTNPGGTYTEAILAAAPESKDGFIKVKKIL